MSPRRAAGRTPVLSRLTRIYGVACVLILLAWAVVIDTWWLQPLNMTTFWWTLPAVVVLPIFLWRRRWLTAAAVAVPAIVWVWSYGTLFVPNAAPVVPRDLRVVTYNTLVTTEGIDHIVRLVDDTNPDIVVLQEVFPDREAALRETYAGRYPHMVAVQTGGVGGVMVLSRFPVADVVDVGASDEAARNTAVIVVEVDGRPVQVVPMHLTSPCPSCGPSMSDRLESEGERRQAEVFAILRALRPGVPAIVAGDFNSNERSGPYRRLSRAGFEDPHRARGSGPGFTWPSDGPIGPMIRIDWVLTRQLLAVDAWVEDGGPSNHRPVVVDLALRRAG